MHIKIMLLILCLQMHLLKIRSGIAMGHTYVSLDHKQNIIKI